MLRILRLPEVADATGYSPTRIAELERDGKFPKRRRLSGGRAVGWVSSEIDDYIVGLPLAVEARPDIGANPRLRGVGKRALTPGEPEAA